MISVPEKKSPKAEDDHERSVRKIFGRWSKTLFVLVLAIWLIYVSLFVKLSAEKFASVMAVPIFIELAILGTGNYFVTWIREASSLRTLLSSVLILVMGLSVVSVNPSSLILGASVAIFGGALIVYGIRKYVTTKDLGIRSQDPIATVSLVSFMSSLVILVLGGLTLFSTLFVCSLILYSYNSLIIDILLTIIAFPTFYVYFGESVIYSVVVLSVGVTSILLGLYLKRKGAIVRLIGLTSTFRLLLFSAYGFMIGLLLIIVYPVPLVIGIGLLLIVLGILPGVVVARRYAVDKSLGIRTQDPVRTIALMILLTSLLMLAGGMQLVFDVLFGGSLVLMTYDRPFISALLTVLIALMLFSVVGVVDLFAVMVIVCFGVVAVPAGWLTIRRRTALLTQAASKRKK